MNLERKKLESIAKEHHINVGYSDEDILIIDNIRNLADPDTTRVNMNLIVVCVEGRVQGMVNGHQMELRKNQVVIYPPNVVFSDVMASPDVEFKALFLTNRILQAFLREKINVWNEVMYVHKTHVFTMEEKDIVYYSHFYELLQMAIGMGSEEPYQTDIVQALLRGAFLGLCGKMKQILPVSDNVQVRSSNTLFKRFLETLNEQSVKHRTVESYASELCITPKYLSFVCKKNSGKTANEWITEHVMEDMRYYLKQTDLSIKEVCNQMGFANPSFFGKYVKDHFGMTPMQFRRS